MDFRSKLPSTAVERSDTGTVTFRDGSGAERTAYPSDDTAYKSATVITRVSGDLYEHAMNEDGTLDPGRALASFHDARKLLTKYRDVEKVSFTATFKSAHYFQQDEPQQERLKFKVEVWNGKDGYKTFTGFDRNEVITKAFAYMDTLDNPTLTMTQRAKKTGRRSVMTKGTYEGRSNLSHVEVELRLDYRKQVEGWVVLPQEAN